MKRCISTATPARITLKAKKMPHCCSWMKEAVENVCAEHPNRFDCPDALIHYSARFDEYGIIVHDGGPSFVTIKFCPWCGTKLPLSKRNRWFKELERLGVRNPLFSDKVPEIYSDNRWYSKK